MINNVKGRFDVCNNSHASMMQNHAKRSVIMAHIMGDQSAEYCPHTEAKPLHDDGVMFQYKV